MKKFIAGVLLITLLSSFAPTIIFAVEDSYNTVYGCNHVFNEVEGSEVVQCDDPRCGIFWIYPKNENTYLQMKCIHCSMTTVAYKKTGCCH